MDPLTVAAGVAVVAGIGAEWRSRRRVRRAEAEATSLRRELDAERHAARHDPLTGLPNRRAFYRLGTALVADPTRHPLVAVMLDLDHFKLINDRFGHAAGDEVLITVARRFATYAGDGLVARLGGDEFAGLFTAPTIDGRWLHPAGQRLAEALGAPMPIAGRSVTVTTSVGLAPVHGCARLSDALHRADAAMYRAKTGRGHRACVAPLLDGDILPTHATEPRHVPATSSEHPARTAPWLGIHPHDQWVLRRKVATPPRRVQAGGP